MTILIVFLGVLAVIMSLLAFPLSDYLSKVEDGRCCEVCDCLQSCFAKKKFLFGKNSWMEEFMLVSFLKVHSYCSVERQWKKRELVSYFIVGFTLVSALFWSEEFDFTTCLYVVSTGALLVLAVVDWKTQYIPFECNVLIFLCGLIRLFADFSNWFDYVIGLFTVSGFLFLVDRVATPVIRKRHGGDAEIEQVVGDGDIKFMAATGLLLGWKLNLLVLVIGCIAGSVIHGILMIVLKKEHQLSFGPYLALGVYISMLCGEQLISWYLSMIGIMPM